MSYWYPGVKEAVDTVREYHGKVPVVVRGVYASLLPEHCRRVVAPDLLLRGNELEPLRDLLLRRSLPVPAGGLPAGPALVEGVWEDAGILRLNRGCPYRCSYCASRLIEPVFERGSGEELWERAVEMNRRFGTRNFAFYDDALLMGKREALFPFLERAVEAKENFSFFLPNAVHIRYLDAETARLMYRAGFEEIRLGYETADDTSTAATAKYERSRVPEAVEALLSAGFKNERIVLYILAGLPGQWAKEVEESLRSAAKLGVRLSLAEYSPVPGTELWSTSLKMSPYPIEKEPLFENNTIFPLEWEGFRRKDMERLKRSSREFSLGR